MTDAADAITLSAALIAGIAGSAHCFAMCGGLAGALSMRVGAANGALSALRDASLYQLGRVTGYTVAGAIVGTLGNAIQAATNISKVASTMRFAAGVLVILVAMRVLSGWNALVWLERLGARFWKAIHPMVNRAAKERGMSRSLLLGLLWGWLPCGLVYSMLLFSALSGDAAHGAAIMLAFGMGTLPAMLASSVLAAQLNSWLKRHGTRQLSGALLLVFGIWLAWAAFPTPHSASHAEHIHALS